MRLVEGLVVLVRGKLVLSLDLDQKPAVDRDDNDQPSNHDFP